MPSVKDVITMKKSAFVKEHKELVDTLKKGSKAARTAEAKEQGNELKKVIKK